MNPLRLLLLFLPLSIASGDEKELFDPLPEPEKTWEHYTDTFFPSLEKGSGILHFVTIPSLEKTVDCLSVMREQTEEGNRYYLIARTLSRESGEEQERKQWEISVRLSSSLRILSSSALKFSADVPTGPKALDGASAMLFVDDYRKPVAVTHSPVKNSVPARTVEFFTALWKEVQAGSIDEDAWVDRSRAVRDGFPKLPWWPTYSEFQGPDLLRKELDIMKDWRLLHMVRYLDMNGFEDSESIRFREELAAALAETAPKQWKELMRSSGNMHNPKVGPIREFMDEATRKTQSVQQVNQILADYRLKVSGLSFEKLSFATKTGEGLPSAMMHFEVESLE